MSKIKRLSCWSTRRRSLMSISEDSKNDLKSCSRPGEIRWTWSFVFVRFCRISTSQQFYGCLEWKKICKIIILGYISFMFHRSVEYQDLMKATLKALGHDEKMHWVQRRIETAVSKDFSRCEPRQGRTSRTQWRANMRPLATSKRLLWSPVPAGFPSQRRAQLYYFLLGIIQPLTPPLL